MTQSDCLRDFSDPVNIETLSRLQINAMIHQRTREIRQIIYLVSNQFTSSMAEYTFSSQLDIF